MGFPWHHWVSALLSTTIVPFYGFFNSGNTLSLVPPQGLCTCCSLTFKWAHLQIFMPLFLSGTEISAQSHSLYITFLTKPSTAAHQPAHTITALCCISPRHLTLFTILLFPGFHFSVYFSFSLFMRGWVWLCPSQLCAQCRAAPHRLTTGSRRKPPQFFFHLKAT